MITVDGGFAKVVNVTNENDGEFVKTMVYVKMCYADQTAKNLLSKELRKYGFKYESSNYDDSRYKIIISKIWDVVL